MDYDNDGKKDIVACGYDGFVVLFLGRGGLDFATATRLKDRAGNEIRGGQYYAEKWIKEKDGDHVIHPLLVDWDQDGDLDLLLCADQGQIHVRTNEGTRQKPVFSAERTQILVEGKPGYAKAAVKMRKPSAAVKDWDGDGLPDLIICFCSRREVVWHRNIGKKGKPNFGRPQVLLNFTRSGKPKHCNRLSVADYNSDGKLDLVIGGGFWIGRDKGGIWVYPQK